MILRMLHAGVMISLSQITWVLEAFCIYTISIHQYQFHLWAILFYVVLNGWSLVLFLLG